MSNIVAKAAKTSMISSMKEKVSLVEWAQRFENRKASGLPVKSWRWENGISPSTYYCHLRKAREKVLKGKQIVA